MARPKRRRAAGEIDPDLQFGQISVGFRLEEPYATELLHFAAAMGATNQVEAVKAIIITSLAQLPQWGLEFSQGRRALTEVREWAYTEFRKALHEMDQHFDFAKRTEVPAAMQPLPDVLEENPFENKE